VDDVLLISWSRQCDQQRSAVGTAIPSVLRMYGYGRRWPFSVSLQNESLCR